MNEYVIDTMAFILKLENRKMPKSVREIFIQAEEGRSRIFIPSFVFAELGYLSEKKRIDTNLQEAKKYLDQYSGIKQNPLSISTIINAFGIDDIPELHDRLIAASAKELNAPILTNDPVIQSSAHVKFIWEK